MRPLVCGMMLVTAPGCAKVDRFARDAEKPVKLVLITAAVFASALESLGATEASGRRRGERSNSRRFSTRHRSHWHRDGH